MTASGSSRRDRLFRRKANPSLAPRRDVRVWVVLVRTVKGRSEIHCDLLLSSTEYSIREDYLLKFFQ